MKYLRPLIFKEQFYTEIEKEIGRIFDTVIYIPLVKALGVKKKEIINSSDPLAEAVAKGSVWFEDGKFYGTYNAQISRRLREIGARFNSKTKTWSYSGALPADISIALTQAATKYSALQRSLMQTLDSIKVQSVLEHSKLKNKYEQTITWIDGDFEKTVKAIGIVPKLTKAQKEGIAKDWSQNLDIYIKDWTESNILKLRQQIMQNTFAGRRSGDLEKIIQQNYGVSKEKARFLARQETSLLTATYREARYTEIGSDKYRWSGAMDERERPDHEALEGKIFSWSNPPITDKKTGRRSHPGEDFGCRCVPIPIIE